MERKEIMAKAYRCDLCNKFSDDCYGISGLDIYPNELIKIGVDKSTRHEVKEICEDCHNKIKFLVLEIFKESDNATTEQ